MRISLIHGENLPAAYEKYRTLVDSSKSKGFEIIQITYPKEVTSQSLFEDKIVFTLEKANKTKLNDWKWLKENASKYNSNLLIFYEGNAPVTIIKNLLKGTRFEKFDLPKLIFVFLDNFNLKIFNELVKTEAVELIFHLFARRLRDLYWIKISPQTLEIPDWQKNKLASQASKFTIDNLKLMINELSEIDIKAKTSDSDLKTLLDLFILKYLK